MALDGYDTLPVRGPGEIVRRFLGMGVDFVIGGERACWPADDVKSKGSLTHEAVEQQTSGGTLQISKFRMLYRVSLMKVQVIDQPGDPQNSGDRRQTGAGSSKHAADLDP